MTKGIGGLLGSLLTYPVFILSIMIVIASTAWLLLGGRQANKNMKTLVIALLIIALSVVLFSVIMAVAFGSGHPPIPPVPR